MIFSKITDSRTFPKKIVQDKLMWQFVKKKSENTSKFRTIVFNAVGIQIFKKTNVPSILHAHKTQRGENMSEVEFLLLKTFMSLLVYSKGIYSTCFGW